ncbi:DUF4136 domain-containing protein [Pleomorphomonas carboxyditropha]|nr:DUF4136 domain-containing protein [Pleomorphomonas carboxyditropha]
MLPSLRALVTIALSAALAGCVTVNSTTTVFHNITKPETFSIRPTAPISESLEAKSYADLIAQKLIENGWSKSDKAATDVQFAYSIDNGHQEIDSVPVFGQTGGGTTYSSGTVYGGGGFGTYSGTSYTPPTFGIVGASTYSYSVYTRKLMVWIDEKSTKKRIYEATVVSRGSSSSFNVVARCMIDALFKDFPGKSGQTTKISADGNKCVVNETKS